jgi:prepilin-type N-terminal cleavage/methylation domain-containing protein
MKRGFTLIEMLMVLMILAVMTVVAVQSLQPLAEQAAYETTRQTLLRIDEAVLGPDGVRQADGTPVISGFAADVGRLPLPVASTPSGSELVETWDMSLWTGYPYGTRHGPIDFDGEDFSHIRIPCGWRGPYLQPASGEGLRDGWGKPLAYVWNEAAAPAANVHDSLSTAADLSFELPDVQDLPRVLPLVSLLVNVLYADGQPVKSEEDITASVYLVHPDPAVPEALAVVPLAEEDGDFTLHGVTPGLRALRVVVKQGEATIAQGDKTVYRHVPRSGLSDVQIMLGAEKPEPVEPEE